MTSADDLSSFLGTKFPEFKSPPPLRLKSLYSDISRQKVSTPEAYQSSLGWWTNTLVQVVKTGHQPNSNDKLILHARDSLIEGLRWDKAATPLGLGVVVLDLSASQDLIPLSHFLSTNQSIYVQRGLASRAASYLVGRPLWWALEQLSLVGDDNSSLTKEERWRRARGDYVVKSVVEEAAEALISHYRSNCGASVTDALYSTATFKEEFAHVALPGVELSDQDTKVLLKFLERDKQVLKTEREVIKFVDIDNDLSGDSLAITEVDRGILEMKLTTLNLEKQVDEIQRQIEERTEKIKDMLRRNSKAMALSYLRSKKQLEELLTKRLGSLETLQTALSKLESAANDLEIMKAYETSTKTLRSILAHPSLQVDAVERTIDNMSEALADHQEIQDAIDLGGKEVRSAAGVEEPDDQELASELEMLVKEKELEEKVAAEEEKKRKEALERRRQEETRDKETRAHREREDFQKEEQRVKDAQARLSQAAQEPSAPVESNSRASWEENFDAAQKERGSQAEKNKQAEVERRARWEQEDRQRLLERA